ncbi:MAG TPA: DinB family protein [Polaromonas sp.]|uniref:DinB family protein n=1 Tax=Polaromonas sp. TaxID=1869339 RepID=UPI002D34C076|nr:DinB family protein [Polaromonas sp.]HYW57475.1 DinB family protein [Polaromonas sp.]
MGGLHDMAEVVGGNYRFLAQYNRWMNQRLYVACETLTDEERKRERGAFFGSIHHTLNHLIVGDQVWLKRFAQCAVDNGATLPSLNPTVLDLPEGSHLDTVVFADWQALRGKREQLDAAIEAWVAEMPAQYPSFVMRYSNSKGVQRAHPAWQAMAHFFNHQTHHRAQVGTLLTQAGVDVGVTDMIALV